MEEKEETGRRLEGEWRKLEYTLGMLIRAKAGREKKPKTKYIEKNFLLSTFTDHTPFLLKRNLSSLLRGADWWF